MDLKFFSLVFGVVLLLAVTGTSSKDALPYVDDRIVGGFEAAVNQFPYQVSLKYMSNGAHFCGGSLVTVRHVLTAAHCIKQSSSLTVRPQDLYVHTGTRALSSGGLVSYVAVIHVHGGYSVNSFVDDIAIIKLTAPLNLTVSTTTIPMRTTTISMNTNCVVTGWGTTAMNGSSLAPILRYVDVPIYNITACRNFYTPNNVRDKMICAGFVNGGKDSCQGDSGGPLVCQGSVAGIVSFGNGCALPNYPGVYTEVSKYSTWIKDAINASLPTSTLSLCLLVVANFAYFLLH